MSSVSENVYIVAYPAYPDDNVWSYRDEFTVNYERRTISPAANPSLVLGSRGGVIKLVPASSPDAIVFASLSPATNENETRSGGADILWDDKPLSRRRQSSEDFLLEPLVGSWNDRKVYYTDLPVYLASQFPMLGTREANTGPQGTMHKLYLPTRTAVYLLRIDGWWGVDLSGWELKDTGPYLGPRLGSNVRIYTKTLEPGYHSLSNTSAMYLFSPEAANDDDVEDNEPGHTFPITIKMITGKEIILDVSTGKSVLKLKQAIEAKEGIPATKQRLLHNGVVLANTEKVSHYDLQRGAQLFLVLQGTEEAGALEEDVGK